MVLSDKDAQLISDVLNLAQEDASLLSKINQQTTVIDQQAAVITQQSNDITKLKVDVNNAQALASASSENLLINPRGKINQANESDGVLAAGVYFCDGWKAGANGAEVYRDADGFRLVSGSIVQLVPNNVEPNQTLRGNLTKVSGTPQIKINGGTDSAQSDSAEYIQFEVSGDNSKFTKLVLAESVELPIYQQAKDELKPCKRFYQKSKHVEGFLSANSLASDVTPYKMMSVYFDTMINAPAVTTVVNDGGTGAWFHAVEVVGNGYLIARGRTNTGNTYYLDVDFTLDARP
uniref:Uncharacterized protein n=1 Tax=Vibrio sp. FF_482 TaxID=1652836 RepID=A0A0H3ZVB4_9VIBR|nr:hypothetical protein [Vibrio sp. FF_482]